MSRNWQFLRTNTAMLIVLVACCALLFGVLRYWRDASPLRETLRRLSDGDATGRLLAARDLGIHQAEETVPALIAALLDPDDRVRSEAIVSLKLFGPRAAPAVPALCSVLHEDRDARFRRVAAEALGMIEAPTAVLRLIDALEDPDEEVREAVATALGRTGPRASACIPNLIIHFEREAAASMRIASLRSLVVCAGGQTTDRSPVIAALVWALRRDPDSRVRELAASALVMVARPAVPTTLPPPQPGRIPMGLVDQMVPALIEAMDDRSREVRLASASGLAQIGLEDPRAVPALCRAVRTSQEPSDSVRQLWKVWFRFTADEAARDTAAIRSALQALLDLLDMKAPEVRVAVVSPLFDIIWVDQESHDSSWREAASRAAQAILAMLKDDREDPRVRLEILDRIRLTSPDGTGAAVRAVGDALASKDPAVRVSAAQVLSVRSRDPRDSEAFRIAWRATIPNLITALRDPDHQVRHSAAAALGNLGPDASHAREPLSKLARDDPDPTVRQEASDAIKSVGSPSGGVTD
jgi:HEAT repeat protein